MNKMSLDHIKGIATCIEDAESLNEKIFTILYFSEESDYDGVKNVSAISVKLTNYIVMGKFNKTEYIEKEWKKIRDHAVS